MKRRVQRLRILPRPPAPGPALKRQRIPEDLAASLRERILSGELPEGSPLRQEAIAAQYQVSRIPVREALRLLDREGLVDLRQPHRGAVVTAQSPEEIGELFDLRALLERDLIVRAVPRASAADVDRAEAVLRRLDAAYRENDPHAWGALNAEFHRTLYLPARREQTLTVLDGVHLLTQRAIRLYHRLIPSFDAANADHLRILKLVRARQAEQAGALVERHVLVTKRSLLEVLEARRATPPRRSPVLPPDHRSSRSGRRIP